MALPNSTFILGIIIVAYLASFILFAILRILTGVSIQRIGYFSLKRITYTPKIGIDIEVRRLGLNLHRPTFAQPTWFSIVLTELAITIDLNATGREKFGDNEEIIETTKTFANNPVEKLGSAKYTHEFLRYKSWRYLTHVKERIKRLHRKIKWISLVDLVATNSIVTLVDIGNIQVGSFTIGVDTRSKMVDRERMSSQFRTSKKQRPAEWIIIVRSILFTAESRDPFEILDHATLDIHGLLYKDLDGLQDASISLKLGRVNLHHDDIIRCIDRYNSCSKLYERSRPSVTEILIADLNEEFSNSAGTQEENLAQSLSDSRGFFRSILRGIKEVQFAVSYVGFTKKVDIRSPHGAPMYFSVSMKEVGIDLHRLDQKSPAHRMYFSSKDIAHQALVAALSIAFGIDDGNGKTERLVYIPMATITVRTTLPSKTVQLAGKNSVDERNANIVSANIVITSPSVDLNPINLALVLSLIQQQPRPSKKLVGPQEQGLMSWLLPKVNVKFSMHEPVIRIALPTVEKNAEEEDFDLIISSISSISLDIESSHSAVEEIHYCLGSTLRLQSHALYYQTSSGAHHELLETESFELKTQISAKQELCVFATGNLQTFSIHMIRPEINDGIRQIVRQLHLSVEPEPKRSVRNINLIRRLPRWLVHCSFQGSNFSAEAAGVDEDISDDTRGVALQLESWTIEYRTQEIENLEKKMPRKRAMSCTPESESKAPPEISNSSDRKKRSFSPAYPIDCRRVDVHLRGLEVFIVESIRKWEAKPSVIMPEMEGTFFTTSDSHGPVFDVTLFVQSLLIHYSLYRHYACGLALTILRKAFMQTPADQHEAELARAAVNKFDIDGRLSTNQFYAQNASEHPFAIRELISFNFKSNLLQLKAQMPSDPAMMLSIYNFEAGRHRWASPFFVAKFAQLYAEVPRVPRSWASIICIKGLRLHHRESKKKKSNGEIINEQLLDINAEAIRLAIPHQLILHKVVDNIINTLKSVGQLHQKFITGINQPMLEKHAETPKVLPKISIRSNSLLFELEDGAFESKLGVIYRTGLVEQKQRLARQAAFDVKEQKIEKETREHSTKNRNRSVHPRGRSKNTGRSHNRPRSRSLDENIICSLQPESQNHKLRYNPDKFCEITSSAKISVKEAYENLQVYNAQSWKRRIDGIFKQIRTKNKAMREAFWGSNETPEDIVSAAEILQISERPALLEALISNLQVNIENPSFPLNELPNFINRIGKGMPHDMQYSLLVPMHVQLDVGETRVTLRDYPLPLLHVPPIDAGQPVRLPALSLKADFVIAEEMRGHESTRLDKVDIVPPRNIQSGAINQGRFSVDVQRTISPVKSYSDIKVCINTSLPTHITWGSSFQPAIQDMMMIIETFTKPQVDPSDRAGFWDKIRLSFHSRVSVAWKGDGDVHLLLKGTRDPYAITGNGAGFLMCWRNDVRWNIRSDDDPRKFMTVDSGEYILAIPDLNQQARDLSLKDRTRDDLSKSSIYKRGVAFKKVIMKLSGNVQWLAGLMFERNLAMPGQRSFKFTPHYNVVLKRPECAKSTNELPYDAFEGFRSNHIHLSIAIKAPIDQDVSSTASSKRPVSYNSVHLSPRFFSHFFAWWSMFDGSMSLPIRQGALWPGIDKSSKKFARHLATIKYNIFLAPLFVSHVYKHKDAADSKNAKISVTGLKIKLDSFMLDVHQRKEEFPAHNMAHATLGKTSGMKMHQAQLDLISADVRAITASIPQITPDESKTTAVPIFAFQQEDLPDLSNFDIPDNDFSWIDMDDFVELDWNASSEAKPETKILPLAYAPRFTYSRRTDSEDTSPRETNQISPFGFEPTHFCIMTQDDDPRQVQYELIKIRMKQLEKQIKSQNLALNEAELRFGQKSDNEGLKNEVEQLKRHSKLLRDKYLFLKAMMSRIATRMKCNLDNLEGDSLFTGDRKKSFPKTHSSYADPPDTDLLAESRNDFSNRFVIHNMQLKWNNLLRNIILRYIHQVRHRRGVVYYLSRRAVKFIIDIVQEQKKPRPKASKRNHPANDASSSTTTSSSRHGIDPVYVELEDRINEILSDCKEPGNVAEGYSNIFSTTEQISTGNINSYISEEFVPTNSYYLYLIAPQIQLQSEKNTKAVVLVTAKGMEAKVVEVMDKHRIFDKVSGLVQSRFSVEMDSIQFFVTHRKWFSSQLLSMYSGNRYGAPTGTAWPPWVPMEVMFDFDVDPFGFKLVVHKTSASLRYDKYNTLRLKDNDEVSSEGEHGRGSKANKENRMDHLRVEFPQIRAICNSAQYYAMYIIVMDLLMFSEPLEKTRNERLEKIMLASDFSDLRGVPEMVIKLQERIRLLDEIRSQFQINSEYLGQEGLEDKALLERDSGNCADELFFMMEAIKTSQRKYDPSKTSGLLRWSIASDQIVWHLIHGNNEPLMEIQLQKAEYDRTDNSDGSHINLIQVGKITGLNLLPDAIYPEILAPYSDIDGRSFHEGGKQKMLRVYWYMLEAIAGIPVMDHFEVNLFPMKIQLERDIGKKLFDYIFPSSSDPKNKSPFMVKNMQPIQDDDEDDCASSLSSCLDDFFTEKPDSNLNSGTEAFESRLKPTLSSEPRLKGSSRRPRSLHALNLDGHQFRIFHSHQRSPPSSCGSSRTPNKKGSHENINAQSITRPPVHRSLTLDAYSLNIIESKSKRFGIRGSSKSKDSQAPDDLTKMMGRASSYMTLAYVKIPSVVLCLSYKGKGERNFEDIHDLVFRLPEIEYRNKTWSNLDLALAFKKDVIRTLISHTGAIVANKFKHRPNTAQQHRQRELASSSMILAPSGDDNSFHTSDSTNSSYARCKSAPRSERSKSPRRSFASSYKNFIRTPSNASSLSHKKKLPNELPMTSLKVNAPANPDPIAQESKPHTNKNGVLGRFLKRNDSTTSKHDRYSDKSGRDEAEDNSKKKLRSFKTILGTGSISN
ncbi:UPF0648 protein [Podosphaera aphanis]|nr:UPF0648 protein [Podosphaera aphanis]